MKTLILSLAILACASTLNAQTEAWAKYTPPKDRAALQTEQLKKALQLNDSQAKKVFEINLKIDQKYDQAIAGGNDGYQRSLNKLGSERDAMMEDVLSGKQYMKYVKMR